MDPQAQNNNLPIEPVVQGTSVPTAPIVGNLSSGAVGGGLLVKIVVVASVLLVGAGSYYVVSNNNEVIDDTDTEVKKEIVAEVPDKESKISDQYRMSFPVGDLSGLNNEYLNSKTANGIVTLDVSAKIFDSPRPIDLVTNDALDRSTVLGAVASNYSAVMSSDAKWVISNIAPNVGQDIKDALADDPELIDAVSSSYKDTSPHRIAGIVYDGNESAMALLVTLDEVGVYKFSDGWIFSRVDGEWLIDEKNDFYTVLVLGLANGQELVPLSASAEIVTSKMSADTVGNDDIHYGYYDKNGISIKYPKGWDVQEGNIKGILVTFSDPLKNKHSSYAIESTSFINVAVGPRGDYTLKDIVDISRSQFGVYLQKYSSTDDADTKTSQGIEAHIFGGTYFGPSGSLERNKQITMIDKDTSYTVTVASLESDWAELEPKYQEVLDSFLVK